MNPFVKAVLFFCLSAPLIYFSLPSFRNIRSHGFPRFFLWEADLALIVINGEVWFRRPFSPLQLISWILLIASALLVITGVQHLRVRGRPDGELENTTRLVETGLYRFIRHPMYSSLLLFGWGVFLKDLSLATSLLVIVITVLAFVTATVEEKEDLDKFGVAYSAYMQRSKRFIPFLF